MSDAALERLLALHAQGAILEDITAGLAAAFLRAGDLAVNGSAGRGCHAWPMALLVGPQGRVLAFEPAPARAAMLRAAATARGLAQVEVVEAAPAERGGMVRTHAGAAGMLTVRALRLDDMLPVSAQPWRFARFDRAGAAHHALLGARAGLARWRPVLVLAHPGEGAPELGADLLGLLAGLDYRLLDLLGRRFGPAQQAATPLPAYLVGVPEGSAEAALAERHLTETVARLAG